MVDMLLGGMKWVSAVDYIDDIIVFSNTWDDHFRHLTELFHAVRRANLQLHPGKCALAPPRTAFEWSDDCQTASDALRRALVSEPLLAHPDYACEFFVDCDGSGEGPSAVQAQPYDDGERIVAYASRSLLEHERKWTATELEAAAVIWALETFRPYIDGVQVTVRTDHEPLECMSSKKSQCRRHERWALRLQEFKVVVAHRPGSQQKHVDCLSRAPVPPKPDQQPLLLDEFPTRTVLHLRSHAPRRTARPAPLLWCAHLCDLVQRRAHKCHIEARLVRSRVLAVQHEPPSAEPSQASGVEVILSQDDADASDVPDDASRTAPHLSPAWPRWAHCFTSSCPPR
ncbi:hypothetical protein Emag_007881 [Eimeria magna]